MDNTTLSNITTFSSLKALNNAKIFGTLDLKSLALLNITKRLKEEFSEDLSEVQKNDLELFLICIQNNNKDICNYRTGSRLTVDLENTAPTITDISTSFEEDNYIIPYNLLVSTFNDIDGDSPNILKITSMPQYGIITYNDINIFLGQEIDLSDFGTLEYNRTNLAEPIDTFGFQISDNNLNTLYSNMATFTLNITASVNQPPSAVGVNSTSILNQENYTFTLADFTSGTTPAYSDPEGDPVESVKITQLPTIGILSLNGIAVSINQIITAANISAGNLSYIGSQVNPELHVDDFNFSLSDTGSSNFTAGGVFTINVAAYTNLAPTVGDGELTVNEGVIITFTRADFTANTTPPYYDPEGDAALDLKITDLTVAGALKLNNVDVVDEQIISFSDIDAGLLTYTQAVGAGGTTATFTFQIADAGSGIFVG